MLINKLSVDSELIIRLINKLILLVYHLVNIPFIGISVRICETFRHK